ncbi:hypothetical protein, partial [Salmonella sp. s58078]|uniref:hypothetical protein n=1 Tax=Salmonella sp. s58078 TaxID=3159699 RepID=UPI003980768E
MHLRTLEIDDCKSLKEVVCAEKEGDGQEKYTSSILPELKKILLVDLPAIESFCHISQELEFPMLNDVEIRNCPELKTFAPGFVRTPNLNGAIQHLYENVSFPILVKMELYAFENMKEIWRGKLLARSFRNLAKLSVWGCNNLQYVFSPWMARYLVHLRTLDIKECESLKEVVRAEKEGDG